MTNTSITLTIETSEPYVREDGKLVRRFIVCGESFERVIDYSEAKGRFVLLDPEKE